jgi:hypothetical protein
MNRLASMFILSLALISFLNLTTTNVFAEGCARPNMKAARTVLVGQGPNAVVVSDFNTDGKNDVAVANSITQDVAVLFGDGTGGFSAPTAYPLGRKAFALIVADFNNDGKPDMATANYEVHEISVLMNSGTGTFTVNHFATGIGPRSLVAGDFNNDGNRDIVTANRDAGNVSLLLGNGAGSFGTPAFFNVGISPTDVAAADFNLDGKLDLVVANAGTGAPATGSISILLGIVSGFSPMSAIPQAALDVVVGDFNNDTMPDFATGRIYLGTGQGTFVQGDTLNVGGYSLQAADLNNDTKLDIAAVNGNVGVITNRFAVALGNGAGGITSNKSYLTGMDARSLAIGDVTGDGKPDIVVAAAAIHSIAISEGDGAGNFDAPVDLPSNIPASRTIADLNGDGKLDIAHTSLNAGVVTYFGNGDATFTPGNFHFMSENPVLILNSDVNMDGKIDLVAGNPGGSISILLNDGTGVFNSHVTFSTGGTPVSVVFGDFNGDGKQDIATSLNGLAVVRVLIGNGLGSFTLTGNTNVGAPVNRMRKGDFNSDGILDLLILRTDSVFSILPGNGAGGFGAEINVPVTGNPSSIGASHSFEVKDVNRDGKPDLIVPFKTAFSSQVLLGNGANGFGPPIEFFAGFNPVGVFVADFNNDHKDDLVINNRDFGYTVVLGDGAGHFGQAVSYTGGAVSGAADFNNDSSVDLLGGSAFGWIVLNKCRVARGVETTDFDGDGRTDIAVFRPSSGTWYILRSSDNAFQAVQFGANGDVPALGDYDGDDRTDIAVFRAGTWYYLRSTDGAFAYQQFGTSGDIPVPADYDGDGVTNFAVFRPSTGYWYTSLNPATNYGAVLWGQNGDVPVPVDYDGDGRVDIAVFRPSNASWHLLQSAEGYRTLQFGIGTDSPAPADYDGDGRANVAVFRPSTGFWYTSTNPNTNYGAFYLGQTGDIPVPGYYDGDAKADVAVFRAGDWYIIQSLGNVLRGVNFGTAGDLPAPAAP